MAGCGKHATEKGTGVSDACRNASASAVCENVKLVLWHPDVDVVECIGIDVGQCESVGTGLGEQVGDDWGVMDHHALLHYDSCCLFADMECGGCRSQRESFGDVSYGSNMKAEGMAYSFTISL